MPICHTPRYIVKIFDHASGAYNEYHVPYLRDVPGVHPLCAHLTKGVIDNIVHRPKYNPHTGALEWRCVGSPRALAKHPFVHIRMLDETLASTELFNQVLASALATTTLTVSC
jgi:hypothetical protein